MWTCADGFTDKDRSPHEIVRHFISSGLEPNKKFDGLIKDITDRVTRGAEAKLAKKQIDKTTTSLSLNELVPDKKAQEAFFSELKRVTDTWQRPHYPLQELKPLTSLETITPVTVAAKAISDEIFETAKKLKITINDIRVSRINTSPTHAALIHADVTINTGTDLPHLVTIIQRYIYEKAKEMMTMPPIVNVEFKTTIQTKPQPEEIVHDRSVSTPRMM